MIGKTRSRRRASSGSSARIEPLEPRRLLAAAMDSPAQFLGDVSAGYHRQIVQNVPARRTDSWGFNITQPVAMTLLADRLKHDGDLILQQTNSKGRVRTVARSNNPGRSAERIELTLEPGRYAITLSNQSTRTNSYRLTARTAEVAAPSFVQATVWSGNEAQVRWKDNSHNETGFRVQQWIRGRWKNVAEANRNATAAVVSGHLQPGHEPLFRVVARRGQAAIASTNTMTVTMNGSDESGWYRVTGLTYKGKGEAGWSARSVTLGIDDTGWIHAGSWQSAVESALSGGITLDVTFDYAGYTKGQTATHTIGGSNAFTFGTAAEVRQIGLNSTRKASHFKDRPQNKVIAVEDAYAELDRDYDDWWWEVEVEKLDDVDLDIDSDRDNGLQPPDRSTREDDLEDAAGEVGKIVAVNDDDRDGDGIPDFADGFGRFADQPESSQPPTAARGGGFVPIVIEVPDALDLALATFRFDYDASDPNGVSRTGSDTPADPYHYTPAPGKLRLWTKDGTAQRDARSIHEGGDYIAPLFGQDTYTPDDWARIGITSSNRTNTLWVEGIGVSQSKGDLPVEFRVDPNGDVFGTSLTLTDRVKITAIDVDVLIGADNASDESLKDDWVGASAGQRQHTIYNWLRFRGPAQLEQQFTVDSVSLGGGTITLQGYNPDGSLRPPGPITATLETGGNGQDTGEFLIRGGNVSTTPDDVAVRASFKGQVFGSETLTVLKFNPEPETSGDSPVPVNPAIVSGAAPQVNGNVFAVDVGRPGFNDQQSNHSSQFPGGAVQPLLTASRKLGIGTIEVVWGRRILTGGTPVVARSTAPGSPLQVSPPDKGFGQIDPDDNFRMRDAGLPQWAETANAQVEYLFGHPSEAAIAALDLFAQDNFAAKISAQAAPTITYPVAVHIMQLVNANGTVLGSLNLTAADVNVILGHVNTVWSQAGIRFSLAAGNLFSPQTTLNADEFDVVDGDLWTTADNVVGINNVPNAIDIYFVRTITNPNWWPFEDGAIAGTARIPSMWGAAGILVAAEFKGKNPPAQPNIVRGVHEMARTLAHELGHYLADRSSHDGRPWNLMVGGDSSGKRDLSYDGNYDVFTVRTTVNPAAPG